MKTKVLVAVVMMSVFVAFAGYGAQEENTAGPQIFMPVTAVEFSSVLEGTTVLNDLTVQNKGTADLEIKEVKTG